jgi:hypothetical protein
VKLRLTIDTVALHGMRVGQCEAFAGSLRQSLEEGLRSRLGVMDSTPSSGRQVERERMSLSTATGAAAIGAGVAGHVLQPARGSRR